MPVEQLLAGDPAIVPLAVLGRLPDDVELTSVVHEAIARLERDAPAEQVKRLMTATFVLAGLRLPLQTAQQVFQGVRNMRDSVTFMAILNEGRDLGREIGLEIGREEGMVSEARKLIVRLGTKRLGAADEMSKAALEAIADLERLERILEHVGEAKDWQQLMQIP